MPEHYFEFYLFGGLSCILGVYLLVYSLLLWLGKRRDRQTRLTHADEMYLLKGYEARQNMRRVQP